MKIFLTVWTLESGHDFHRKTIQMGKIPLNVGAVTALFLCKSSDGGLYLYKVSCTFSGRY